MLFNVTSRAVSTVVDTTLIIDLRRLGVSKKLVPLVSSEEGVDLRTSLDNLDYNHIGSLLTQHIYVNNLIAIIQGVTLSLTEGL